MSKLKILDLCSGIGGFSLGLESTGGFETIAFCEFDPFCQKVLNKHWPEVPIYNDLKEISKDEETIRNIPEHDLICGGIPCQPFSVAGKQKGKEDDRHLWPYMFKIIEQKKPTWVIVENVGGFINVALDDVCLDLEAEGYATQSFIIPACGVEAPHRRDRIWIIGKQDVVDSDSTRTRHGHGEVQGQNGEVQQRNDYAESNHASEKQDVADSNDNGHEGRLSETRDQDVTGQDSQSIRATDTKDFIGQSNDGGDNQESRVNGAVSKSSDDGKTESSRTKRVRGVSEESNDHQGAVREDGLKENNDRALVQKGQKGIQPSIDRTLGSNQTTSKGTEVRQGTDNDGIYRVAESEDVADSDNTRDRASRGEVDENREETIERREEQSQFELSGSSEDVADSDSERLQGQRAKGDGIEKKSVTTEGSESKFKPMEEGWWQSEPRVGRVANGIPNRVDRLKSLGNAIVPQIIYHIGLAILKEEE